MADNSVFYVDVSREPVPFPYDYPERVVHLNRSEDLMFPFCWTDDRPDISFIATYYAGLVNCEACKKKMGLSREDRKYLDTLLADLLEAEGKMRDALVTLCPGEHHVKQHRDKRPPWCDNCGRDDRGRQVR